MMRIGFAKDIHRLVEHRPLILGGILIPYEKGLLGHSDADVVLHSVAESLLGALALGDLGKWFPDTDNKYKDMDSKIIVQTVMEEVKKRNYSVQNIDISIVAEKPKLAPYILDMRTCIAKLLQVEIEQVSVKAGTNEQVDDLGKGLAIESTAICLLTKIECNK